MSLHPDHLVPEYQTNVQSQRTNNDFLWGLLQNNNEHRQSWVERLLAESL